MIHKSNWKAARASGVITTKNYLLNAIFMGSAFILFYSVTGEARLSAVLNQNAQTTPMTLALVLLLMAAMTQSAIWPFHRWLISSLNSPTPVSAIMHAGLINGGGFLLARFAPLYLQHPILLNVLFSLGITSAFIGTLWKLLQNDVKRMLACSTMGQMGFMLAQCGLGLFPAAIAHLVWHGMFKAYLFLASGSAAQEKRLDLAYPVNAITLICALLCGIPGSLAFGYVTGYSWTAGDTTLVLMVMTFLAASQFALTLLQTTAFQKIPFAMLSTASLGIFYGFSVETIEWLMKPLQIMQPQPLNSFHIVGIVAMTLAWLSMLLFRQHAKNSELPAWMLRLYVAALNHSQPHPATVTTHRNHYQY